MPPLSPAQIYLNRFLNRPNDYALQNNNGSYTAHRNQPVTLELLEDHLIGIHTLGVYAISPENTAKWLCWDIDTEAEEQIEKLIRWLGDFGINCIRASKRLGRSGHIYVFCSEPMSSIDAFRILKHAQFLWQIPGEVFPAQTSLRPGQVGSLVRLELGKHRKPSANGVWGLFDGCDSPDVVKQLFWFLEQPTNRLEDINRLLETIPQTQAITHRKRAKQHTIGGKLIDEFPNWDWLPQPSGELLGRCPKCAQEGHDLKGNNLSLNPETNVLYCHYSGGIHSFQQILKAARSFRDS
jgi:hypothetical protein